MKKESQQKDVKYPENRKLKSKLNHDDSKEIAKKSGMSQFTIRDMLNGKLKLTDKVKKAIIELLTERQNLDNALDQIINQEEE